jgi:hypothetical protein
MDRIRALIQYKSVMKRDKGVLSLYVMALFQVLQKIPLLNKIDHTQPGQESDNCAIMVATMKASTQYKITMKGKTMKTPKHVLTRIKEHEDQLGRHAYLKA